MSEIMMFNYTHEWGVFNDLIERNILDSYGILWFNKFEYCIQYTIKKTKKE